MMISNSPSNITDQVESSGTGEDQWVASPPNKTPNSFCIGFRYGGDHQPEVLPPPNTESRDGRGDNQLRALPPPPPDTETCDPVALNEEMMMMMSEMMMMMSTSPSNTPNQMESGGDDQSVSSSPTATSTPHSFEIESQGVTGHGSGALLLSNAEPTGGGGQQSPSTETRVGGDEPAALRKAKFTAITACCAAAVQIAATTELTWSHSAYPLVIATALSTFIIAHFIERPRSRALANKTGIGLTAVGVMLAVTNTLPGEGKYVAPVVFGLVVLLLVFLIRHCT